MSPRPDVIVVGSGFGGGPMAARLAAAGRHVVVLERGPWWGPTSLGRDRTERRDFPRGPLGIRRVLRNLRWDRGGRHLDLTLNIDGLFEVSMFDHLVAAAASGVGGGSLVYTNMAMRAPDTWLRRLPATIGADGLEDGYDAVEALLHPVPVPNPGLRHRRFGVAAVRAGLQLPQHPPVAVAFGADPARPSRFVNAAGVEQGTCVECGECVMGCPHRAKTTVDLTYIALAEQWGADIRALCEVQAIGPGVRRRGDASSWEVRYRDHRDGTEHIVTAPVLVLAAGTLNTLRLLVEARDRHHSLPHLPPSLGAGLAANADMGALVTGLALGDEGGRGPSVGTVSQPGDRAMGSDGARMVADMAMPATALPLPGPLGDVARSMMLLLAMGVDQPGSLGWDGSGITTDVGRATGGAVYDEIEADLTAIVEHLGGRGLTNLPGGPGSSTVATVHALGGAAVGDDPATSVVDHAGQVWGHPGLLVTDGTALPGSPGVPPSLTIAAFAERAATVLNDSA